VSSVVSPSAIKDTVMDIDIMYILRNYDRVAYNNLIAAAAESNVTVREVEEILAMESVKEFIGEYIGDVVNEIFEDGEVRPIDAGRIRRNINDELDNVLEIVENESGEAMDRIPEGVIRIARDTQRRDQVVNFVAERIENEINFNQINQAISENESTVQTASFLMSTQMKIIIVTVMALLCILVVILTMKNLNWMLAFGLITLFAGITTLLLINTVGDIISNVDIGNAVAIRIVNQITITLTEGFQISGIISIVVGIALLITYMIVKLLGVGGDTHDRRMPPRTHRPSQRSRVVYEED